MWLAIYIFWAHDPGLSSGLLPQLLIQASQQRELRLGSSAGAQGVSEASRSAAGAWGLVERVQPQSHWF